MYVLYLWWLYLLHNNTTVDKTRSMWYKRPLFSKSLWMPNIVSYIAGIYCIELALFQNTREIHYNTWLDLILENYAICLKKTR